MNRLFKISKNSNVQTHIAAQKHLIMIPRQFQLETGESRLVLDARVDYFFSTQGLKITKMDGAFPKFWYFADFIAPTDKEKYFLDILELAKTSPAAAVKNVLKFYNIIPLHYVDSPEMQRSQRASDLCRSVYAENHGAIDAMEALIKSGMLHSSAASIAAVFVKQDGKGNTAFTSEEMRAVLVNTDSYFWDILSPEIIKAGGDHLVRMITAGAARVRAEASAAASAGAAGGAGA